MSARVGKSTSRSCKRDLCHFASDGKDCADYEGPCVGKSFPAVPWPCWPMRKHPEVTRCRAGTGYLGSSTRLNLVYSSCRTAISARSKAPPVSVYASFIASVERHFSAGEPSVIECGHTESRFKRGYITMRIPESVVERVHCRPRSIG